jgi:hypothetical protein
MSGDRKKGEVTLIAKEIGFKSSLLPLTPLSNLFHINSHTIILPKTIYVVNLFMAKVHFEWDETKDLENQEKHHVPFAVAQRVSWILEKRKEDI